MADSDLTSWITQLSQDFVSRCVLNVDDFIDLMPSHRTITDTLKAGEGMIDSRNYSQQEDDEQSQARDAQYPEALEDDRLPEDNSDPEHDDSGTFNGHDFQDDGEEAGSGDDPFVQFLNTTCNAEVVGQTTPSWRAFKHASVRQGKRQAVKPLSAQPGLLKTPYGTQLKVAAAIEYAATSPFRGLILADVMGSGKTISALLGAQALVKTHGGLCLYVCPAPLTRQVFGQINELFGSVRTMNNLHCIEQLGVLLGVRIALEENMHEPCEEWLCSVYRSCI